MSQPHPARVSDRTEILWIDWGTHVRSRTLSAKLGVHLAEICATGPRLWRYVESSAKTIALIRAAKPAVVIGTTPSIVLGYLLLLLRTVYRFRLVADAHYFGVRAGRRITGLQRLLDFYNSRVDLVIVTNESHAELLRRRSSDVFVCQDPVPSVWAASAASSIDLSRSVFLICSFDADEPYEAAFAAFASMPEFTLFVSGDYLKAGIDIERFPWVRFLGFLPYEEYVRYLCHSAVIMDLTTLEDCLVCGAYEALSARKPLILSRTRALSDYFGHAAIVTENSPDAIRESVRTAIARSGELSRKAEEWIRDNNVWMAERVRGLSERLRLLSAGITVNATAEQTLMIPR